MTADLLIDFNYKVYGSILLRTSRRAYKLWKYSNDIWASIRYRRTKNVITFAVKEKKTNQRGRNDNGTRESTTVNKDNRIGEYLFIDDQPKTVEIQFFTNNN